MSKGLISFKNFINVHRVSFAQKSIFYRLSLDKKYNIFDTSKFITDPWSGSSLIGKDILDCNFIPRGITLPVNLLEIFSGKTNKNIDFAAGFSWIRDLQAVGGNNSRKYTRNLISTFITNYRKIKKFWIKSESWEPGIIGERIVNWIFSYSFFASGSNDKFQKEILSSIAEQFSHLLKCYKAVFEPYSRLMALKAIIFCLCSMKTNQSRMIKNIIKEICILVDENFDKETGMFFNRNPIDHFNMFRSLLEIRFMAKNLEINLPDDFHSNLTNMASCIRFLRLGDGGISNHLGNTEYQHSFMIPSQHIIDTALSIVEVKHVETKVNGFDRLSTKKTAVVINTMPSDGRSRFNSISEPGINIFDFEASFGTERLINRSDISVVVGGYRIKLDKNSRNFFKKTGKEKFLVFEGETQSQNNFFKFAMRREISIATNKNFISGTDFVFISSPFEVSFRFTLNKNCEIKEINSKNFLITLNKSEYIFNLNDYSSENIQINLCKKSEVSYPSVELFCEVNNPKDISVSWSIENIK